MMAAAQSFHLGRVSRDDHMPNDATITDCRKPIERAGKLGVKANASNVNGSITQPAAGIGAGRG